MPGCVMHMSSLGILLEEVYQAKTPVVTDLVRLLSLEAEEDLKMLFAFADRVRREFCADGILLRGIVEFSNYCRNSCFYCGLSIGNRRIQRYRMSLQEVLESVGNVYSFGVRTVVLQSGEDEALGVEWVERVVGEVKRRYPDMAVTLSVGERDTRDYQVWRQAGADRYLLKIETSDPGLYSSIHAGRDISSRLRCLEDLKAMGYQVGSGNIIGLKGQTLEHIAGDIVFFARNGFDMIGIGPFLPHPETPFAGLPAGDIGLTLKTLAVTRIVTRNAHLPATTALGSAGKDYRIEGLKAGANVIMPNFTPAKFRRLYEIYPGRRCVDEPAGACCACLEGIASSCGRSLDYSRGDSLKKQ